MGVGYIVLGYNLTELQILKQTRDRCKEGEQTQGASAKTWTRQLHPGRSLHTASRNTPGRRTAGSRPKPAKGGRSRPRVSLCTRGPPQRVRPGALPGKRRARGAPKASLCRAAAEARPPRPAAPRGHSWRGARPQHGEDGQPPPRLGGEARAACGGAFWAEVTEKKREAKPSFRETPGHKGSLPPIVCCPS